jgi:hypothetical protein
MVPAGCNTQCAAGKTLGGAVKRVLLPLALATIVAVPVQALASGTLTRTFVSSTGVDSNPCTIAQPCATFAAAYAAAASNGIVAALDPGKYGPVTITSSITIDGNGWAAITAPLGPILTTAGIYIPAATSPNVILRGLTIDGANASAGSGPSMTYTSGIGYYGNGSLTVDGCVIRNMSGVGLEFFGNSTSASAQTLSISNTTINNAAQEGLVIFSGNTGPITASVVHSILINNADAIQVNATGAVAVAIKDSVISNNQAAISSFAGAGTTANVTVTRTQIANSIVGVSNGSATSTIWLAQSTVVNNNIPYDASQGPVKTYQNNYFASNGAGIGSLTNAAQQ